MSEYITREEATTYFIKTLEVLNFVSDSIKKGKYDIFHDQQLTKLIAAVVQKLTLILELKNPDYPFGNQKLN